MRPRNALRHRVLGLIVSLWLGAAAGSTAFAIEVGDHAPDFTLSDLSGMYHTLSGYSSHPVLLMFLECDGATSISTAPLVQNDFFYPYVSRGLFVLGLDTAGCDSEALTQFQYQTSVDFPLLSNAGSTASAYGLVAPSFVILDGGGTVRYVGRGPGTGGYDPSTMRGVVEQCLREANNTKTATWGLIKSLYSG
ncbi:MAG: redoxin domain-containing protein [Candidatus Eisenbacteria bacterium]